MQGILGVDIGTSATEGCLVSLSDGKVISRIQVNYPPGFENPDGYPHGAEQKSKVWSQAAIRVINELSRAADNRDASVEALAISSMVGGLNIPVDRDWKALRTVPIWLDRRATREAKAVAEAFDAGEMGRVTGNPDISPYFGFTKLLWYVAHNVHMFGRTHAFLTPHGAVVRTLTGEHCTDLSSLGAFGGVLDLEQAQVSGAMLERLSNVASELSGEEVNISPELFGRVVPSDSIVGEVTSGGAGLSGLPEGIPVVASGVDAAVALLASGGRVPGDNTLLMGTSWCLGILSDRATHAQLVGMVNMPHVLRGRTLTFSMTGGSYTGGTAGFWMPEMVTRSSFEDLEREANVVPPGSDGLVFLPYLMGDRTPLGRPEVTGAFIGLRAEHNRGHMFRAVMEGGALQHAECMEQAAETGIELAPTRIVDGAYRSPLWRVMVADITERSVLYHPKFPGVSYGDAMLAAIGSGLETEDRVFGWVPKPRSIEPTADTDVEAAYARARELYTRFRHALYD
jgi:sugar (pentulose or hexulose) kinase